MYLMMIMKGQIYCMRGYMFSLTQHKFFVFNIMSYMCTTCSSLC